MTQIYCDIADIKTIKNYSKKKIVTGFTTNPSLMRKAGAKNYEMYSKEILKVCKKKPISFEVFADNYNNISLLPFSSFGLPSIWPSSTTTVSAPIINELG